TARAPWTTAIVAQRPSGPSLSMAAPANIGRITEPIPLASRMAELAEIVSDGPTRSFTWEALNEYMGKLKPPKPRITSEIRDEFGSIDIIQTARPVAMVVVVKMTRRRLTRSDRAPSGNCRTTAPTRAS